jgi:ubiquinone/menaquinone biosynthesis C-methylase UbiE
MKQSANQHNQETGAAPKPAPQTDGQVISWPLLYELILLLVTRGKEKDFRRFVADLVELRPGETVLDVGCGTGTQALIAKEAVGAAGRVCGIEPSLKMIAYARRKAARRGLVVDLQPGVIEQLDYPDQSFEVIFCLIVMHHLPDETKLQGLKEMARVLKPGGRLLVVDSNLHLLPSFEQAGFSKVKAGTVPSISGYDFMLWKLDPAGRSG